MHPQSRIGMLLVLFCAAGFFVGRLMATCPSANCWACIGVNPPVPNGNMVSHDAVAMDECWCVNGIPTSAWCRTEVCTNCPTSQPDITAKNCMSQTAAQSGDRLICLGPCP